METIVQTMQAFGQENLRNHELAFFNRIIGTQQQIRDMHAFRATQLRDAATQLNNNIERYAPQLVAARHQH